MNGLELDQWAEVKAAIPDCARRANVEMRIAGEWQFGSERFDPGCIRLIREAAQRRGVAHRDILSQAGHDAYYVSRIAPTAMIFTPCRDGITHNNKEFTTLEEQMPGVETLDGTAEPEPDPGAGLGPGAGPVPPEAAAVIMALRIHPPVLENEAASSSG